MLNKSQLKVLLDALVHGVQYNRSKGWRAKDLDIAVENTNNDCPPWFKALMLGDVQERQGYMSAHPGQQFHTDRSRGGEFAKK
jgi:hypothetical protein